ncbi:MAG: GNAT family N-acetyltransferase [Phototrophicaceae bacterium]
MPQSTNVTVQPAQAEDIPALVALWAEQQSLMQQLDPRLALWAAEHNITPQQLEARFYATLSQPSPHVGLWSAKSDPKLLGGIHITVTETGATVDTLFIDAHHGQGVGSALLDAVQAWLQANHPQVKSVNVTVPKGFAVEQAFWRAKGASVLYEVMLLPLKGGR